MPKNFRILDKGFAHLLVLVLLLVGIGVGLVLIKNPQIFRPKASENTQVTPVFRLYLAAQDLFYYTTNTSERDGLVAAGWAYDANYFSGYVYPSAQSGTTAIYILYNKANGNNHYYTASQSEANSLAAGGAWVLQGPVWYAYPSAQQGTTKVFRLYNTNSDHFYYTINEGEKNSLSNNGQNTTGWTYDPNYQTWYVYSAPPTVVVPASGTISIDKTSCVDPCQATINWSTQDTTSATVYKYNYEVGNSQGILVSSLTSGSATVSVPVGTNYFNLYNGTNPSAPNLLKQVQVVVTAGTPQPSTNPAPILPPPVSSATLKPIYNLNRKDNGNVHFFTANPSERDGLIASGDWVLSNTAFYAYTDNLTGTVPVYNLYRKDNGNIHFFTVNETEEKGLVASGDWLFSNIAFYVYSSSQGTTAPVYNLNRKDNGNIHFYTINPTEKNGLVASGDWLLSNVGWYAYTTDSTTPPPSLAPSPAPPVGDSNTPGPIYQVYRKDNGNIHFYTANSAEKSGLIATGDWLDGGIAWYSFAAAGGSCSQGKAVYNLYRKTNGNIHFYTINPSEKDGLVSSGDWLLSNIGWCANPPLGSVCSNTSAPVYNLNRKDNGNIHFYTINGTEKDGLVSSGDWLLSNVGWCAYKTGASVTPITPIVCPDALPACLENETRTSSINADGCTVYKCVSTALLGDLNHDGAVDLIDFNIFVTDWQTKDLAIDLNNSGDVDIFDFNVFVSSYIAYENAH